MAKKKTAQPELLDYAVNSLGNSTSNSTKTSTASTANTAGANTGATAGVTAGTAKSTNVSKAGGTNNRDTSMSKTQAQLYDGPESRVIYAKGAAEAAKLLDDVKAKDASGDGSAGDAADSALKQLDALIAQASGMGVDLSSAVAPTIQELQTYTANKATTNLADVPGTTVQAQKMEAPEEIGLVQQANIAPVAEVQPFVASDTYNKAMEYTNQLLEQLRGGRTQYSDALDDLLNQLKGGRTKYSDTLDELAGKIANRGQFSYDPNSDALFQAMLASYTNKGNMAMQDTMGQAAALTGGYGSSYATQAAGQAYNQYLQAAYDNLPEYAQFAFDQYNQQGQDLYNQFNMYGQLDNTAYSRALDEYARLATADDTAYNRLVNEYGLNADAAQQLYNNEYGNYWQTQGTNVDIAQNNTNRAFQDYWNWVDANTGISQFNIGNKMAVDQFNIGNQLDVDRANASNALNLYEWGTEFNADQDWRQIQTENEKINYGNQNALDQYGILLDGILQGQQIQSNTLKSLGDNIAKASSNAGNAGNASEATYPKLTSTLISGATDAYKKGGWKSVDSYLTLSGIDTENVSDAWVNDLYGYVTSTNKYDSEQEAKKNPATPTFNSGNYRTINSDGRLDGTTLAGLKGYQDANGQYYSYESLIEHLMKTYGMTKESAIVAISKIR